MAKETPHLQHSSQPRNAPTARGWAEKAATARMAIEETNSLELKGLLTKIAQAFEAMGQ